MKQYIKAKVVVKETGDIEAVASSPKEDRDGEVLEIAGWDLKEYKNNPVMLYNHNPHDEPIGRAENIRVEENKLKFNPVFATSISKRATRMYEYVKAGILNTFSVGFIPKDSEGSKIKNMELLEISLVPVPANPDARVIARSKGFDWDKIETDLELKKVVPFKSYPKAPVGAAWSGPKERAAADVAALKKMSTWFDPENADKKSAYKLPHHRASGFTTVWAGTKAAMGALLGARGGVQIPDSDRRGVYNHLKKHYAEFDKEAPEFKYYDEQIDDFKKEVRVLKEINDGLNKKLAARNKPKKAENSTKSTSRKVDYIPADYLANKGILQAIVKLASKRLYEMRLKRKGVK